VNPEDSSVLRRAAILKITEMMHTCTEEGLITQIHQMLQASTEKDSHPDDMFERRASLSTRLHEAQRQSRTCPDLPTALLAHSKLREAMQHNTAPELLPYAASPPCRASVEASSSFAYAQDQTSVSSCQSGGSSSVYSTMGTLPPCPENLEVPERKYPYQVPDFHEGEQQPYGQSVVQSQAMGKGGRGQTHLPSRVQVHGAGVSSEGAVPRLSDMDFMARLQGLGQPHQWANMPPRMGPDEGPDPSQLHGGSPSAASSSAGNGGPPWAAPSPQPPRQPPRMGADPTRPMTWNMRSSTKEQPWEQEAAPGAHKWQPRQVLTEGALPSWREANPWEQKTKMRYPHVGRTGQLVHQAVQHRPTAASVPFLPFHEEQPEAAPDAHKWQPQEVLTEGALPSWREANLWEQKTQRQYPHVGRTGQLVNQAVQHRPAAASAPDLPFHDEQPDRMFQGCVLQHPMRAQLPPPAHLADLTTALARTASSPSTEQISQPGVQADEVDMTTAARAKKAVMVPSWDPTAASGVGKDSPEAPDWEPNAPVAPGWDAKGRGKGSPVEASRKGKMRHSHSQQGIFQRKHPWKAYTEGALPRMEEDSLWEQDAPRHHRDSWDAANTSHMLWNLERQSHCGRDAFHAARASTAPELADMNCAAGAQVRTDGDLPLLQQLAALADQPGCRGTSSGSSKGLGKEPADGVPTDGGLTNFQWVKVPTEGDLPTIQQLFGKAEKRVTFGPRLGKGVSSSQQLRPPPGLQTPPELGASADHVAASPCATAEVAAAAATAAAATAAAGPNQIWEERL